MDRGILSSFLPMRTTNLVGTVESAQFAAFVAVRVTRVPEWMATSFGQSSGDTRSMTMPVPVYVTQRVVPSQSGRRP